MNCLKICLEQCIGGRLHLKAASYKCIGRRDPGAGGPLLFLDSWDPGCLSTALSKGRSPQDDSFDNRLKNRSKKAVF